MAPGAMILVLDEGTTSTRALLFEEDGTIRGSSQRPISPSHPRRGWVEQDAGEIWAAILPCARELVAAAGGADRIGAIGIANQRETIVAWDRSTGELLAPAERPLSGAARKFENDGQGRRADAKAAGSNAIRSALDRRSSYACVHAPVLMHDTAADGGNWRARRDSNPRPPD